MRVDSNVPLVKSLSQSVTVVRGFEKTFSDEYFEVLWNILIAFILGSQTIKTKSINTKQIQSKRLQPVFCPQNRLATYLHMFSCSLN